MGILRWELGDLWTEDQLSPATVMTLGESPLLSAARPAVAELRRQEESSGASAGEDEVSTVPVEETPLEAPEAADNGVTARTLVPTDPSSYTVVGRAYISNSTDYQLSIPALQENFAAELTPEEPQILILHPMAARHTACRRHGVVWSGDHRTTDSRYNVVKVGDVMAEVFAEAGISVLHDRTLYDYPSSYNGRMINPWPLFRATSPSTPPFSLFWIFTGTPLRMPREISIRWSPPSTAWAPQPR